MSPLLDHLSTAACIEIPTIMLLGLLIIRRRYRSALTARGSARWMTVWHAARIGLFKGPGLIIGDWKRSVLLPVYYRGNSNIVTVGPPGSMKGIGMLIPNALRWPFLFLYDPGGEISAVCIKVWRLMGYTIHLINPSGMHGLPSSGFNVLDRLDPKSDTFSSDALLLASNLVERTKDPDHWEKKGFGSYQKLLMHNKLFELPEHQNLARIRKYVTGSMDDWLKLITDLQDSKNEAVKGLGNEWARMVVTPKEFSGIVSTMESATMWLDDDIMKRAVCDSGTRFDDLNGRDATDTKLKGAIVSVIIPLEFKEVYAPFVRLAIASMLIARQRAKADAYSPKLLVMLDEFASLNRVDMVVEGLATLRKYKVWIHMAIQHIGQMSMYQDGWSKIEAGCELRQYLASWDAETAEHVSKACGTSTVEETSPDGRTSNVARRMIMPEEVTQMSADEQIVFIGNNPPAVLKIQPYWQRPELQGTFNDNPYHGETPGLQKTWRIQALRGQLMLMLSGLKGPAAIIAGLVVAAIIAGWEP